MKKIFVEPIILYIYFAVYVVSYVFLAACIVIVFFKGTVPFFVIAACVALCVLAYWYMYNNLWPRQDFLIVTENYAEWWCFLKRKHRIYYDQCKRIAVETFNKESHGPVVRGDEFAMIYFTVDSYPEELRGRINRLRCTDEIIKFRYSDKLAKTVLDVAPKEKTRLLYSFYNQMQNYDSQIKRRRRKKRKKYR